MNNANNKCKVFVCYTEYTLLTAMILRRAYQISDNCILILSGYLFDQLKGNIGNNTMNNAWKEILFIDVSDKVRAKDELDSFVFSHNIETVYIAQISVFITHYLVNILGEDIEINMFDEGVSSLEIEKVYSHLDSIRDIGSEYSFRFDRINNYYVLFPEVTSHDLIRNIKNLGLSLLQKHDIKQLLCECGEIFGFTFFDVPRKRIVYIDEPFANIGLMSENAENHFINTIFKCVPAEETIIKEKPYRGDKVLSKEERFSFSGVSFFDDYNIPFEIIYMYLALNGSVPEIIINNGSSLGYNIALINKVFNNDNSVVVSTDLLEQKFMIDEDKEHSLNVIYKMKTYFGESGYIEFPQSLEEFCNIIKRNNIGTKQCIIDYKEEYEWLLDEYEALIVDEIIHEKVRGGFLGIAYNIWGLHLQHRNLADLFRERGIDKIYIFGTGLVSKMITSELTDDRIEIIGFIRSNTFEGELFAGKRVYLPSAIPCSSHPIIIAVNGRDGEIIEYLEKNNVKNELLTINDLFKNEKSLRFFISKLYE